MAFFKSTYNILVKVDEDEVFNENWMDSDSVITPPTSKWTYDRDMQIEDVDIWEVLYEQGGGVGIYASWCPHAEFYMITAGGDYNNRPRIINGLPYSHRLIETFYGADAQKKVFDRAKELGINLPLHQVWVDQEDLWLYQKPEIEQKMFFPSKDS